MEINKSSWIHESSDSEADTDQELQTAFRDGKLKGLSYELSAKAHSINNKAGLRKTLEEFSSGLDWLERMDLTVDPVSPPKMIVDQLGEDPDDLGGADVHNDYKREMKFYRQGQAAVLVACPRLHSLCVLTKRPSDYIAEMVKSDAHMDKIRQKLLSIREGKERSEKARKLRDLRKFGKKVQQEVLIKRQKEKKEMLNALKSYKKGKTSSLQFLDDHNPKKDTTLPVASKTKETVKPNKKRQLKNSKFGFGGQKKRSKLNTKESVDNFVNVPRFSGNKSGSKKKHGTKKNRPGKKNRQKSRNNQGQ